VSTRIQLRDFWRTPALLSWSRLLFGAVFPFVVEEPLLALAVLIAAGLSDVLDGWVARRYRMVTAAGTVLDPITDKLFVLSVAVSLVATGRLTWWMVLLLSVRELGEIPLVLWYSFSRAARSTHATTPMANFGGKLATLLQFAVVTWALFQKPYLELGVAVSSVAEALAVFGYWRRALRDGAQRNIVRSVAR
jgi:cardiolipin synthase